LKTNAATLLTQVLPNGNLRSKASGDPRQLRKRADRHRHRAPRKHPERQHQQPSKIAQARIAYGGRDQITDVQQPRYGQQVMDVLLPF